MPWLALSRTSWARRCNISRVLGSLGDGGGSKLVMMDDAKAEETEHDGME